MQRGAFLAVGEVSSRSNTVVVDKFKVKLKNRNVINRKLLVVVQVVQ